MRVSFKGDTIKMAQSLERMKTRTPVAVARALNRTIESSRTQAVRSISADLGGIRQKNIRDAMDLTKATPGKPEAALHVTGRRLPLMAFGARQTTEGVTYKLPTGRNFVRSAFIAIMRSGHQGVFKRRTLKRLPIDELHGPSLPRVFTRDHVLAAVRSVARSDFLKNLKHELSFLTKSA